MTLSDLFMIEAYYTSVIESLPYVSMSMMSSVKGVGALKKEIEPRQNHSAKNIVSYAKFSCIITFLTAQD